MLKLRLVGIDNIEAILSIIFIEVNLVVVVPSPNCPRLLYLYAHRLPSILIARV